MSGISDELVANITNNNTVTLKHFYFQSDPALCPKSSPYHYIMGGETHRRLKQACEFT